MNETNKHVVLAFSGGLDTSFCVVYLREQGYTVTTVTVDTGGFDTEALSRIEAISSQLGAQAHYTVDGRAELFHRYLRYLIFGNVLRGNLYPLSVSAERVAQAAKVVAVAKALGATSLAHGSTGAGNDQVRFDVAFQVLAPEMELLTPIRTLALSRAEERSFLAAHNFEIAEKVEHYSVNEGMWGTSIGGRETLDSWSTLPEDVFPGGPVDTNGFTPRTITLGFEQGLPVTVNGNSIDPVPLVIELNSLGRRYGIGRGVHLGDTILGIKGRVGFEAPAASLLIGAHRELEKLVLTGKQQFWKDLLGNLYGQLLHEGHFFDPLARDLEAFLISGQQQVTGEVKLSLYPRTWSVDGVRSPHSLMDGKVAGYGETNHLWNGAEVAGFAKLYGIQQLLALRAGAKE